MFASLIWLALNNERGLRERSNAVHGHLALCAESCIFLTPRQLSDLLRRWHIVHRAQVHVTTLLRESAPLLNRLTWQMRSFNVQSVPRQGSSSVATLRVSRCVVVTLWRFRTCSLPFMHQSFQALRCPIWTASSVRFIVAFLRHRGLNRIFCCRQHKQLAHRRFLTVSQAQAQQTK